MARLYVQRARGALHRPDHVSLVPLDEGCLARTVEPGLTYSDDSGLGYLSDCGRPSSGAILKGP